MVLAEPVERKFLKALKNSDIEAIDFASQLDEGVREGWITADERKQLEELRAMTLDAISVDDFEAWELRSAGYEQRARRGQLALRGLRCRSSRSTAGSRAGPAVIGCSRAPCAGARPTSPASRPRITVLEPGRCEASIAHRRKVTNHIGTVHAIALCNLAEFAGGLMTDVSIPASMRWIPKGMTVEYLGKANGTMRAVATPESRRSNPRRVTNCP